MRYAVEKASDVAGVIRAVRKAQQLRQNDAAGSIGVSESFMVKVERGAETVQWGKLFQILEGLGVRIEFDLPDAGPDDVAKEAAKARRRAATRRERHANRAINEKGTTAASSRHGASSND